jgi:hypothetical protein
MDNNITKKENQLVNQVAKQEINLYELMKKIESDTIKKISVLNNTKSDICSNDICNIMKTGDKEFIEKTGRNMTYSEIRRMFG